MKGKFAVGEKWLLNTINVALLVKIFFSDRVTRRSTKTHAKLGAQKWRALESQARKEWSTWIKKYGWIGQIISRF